MIINPIKVGVVGVGHLGQHHVKHYASIKEADLIGLFDIDPSQANKVAQYISDGGTYPNPDCPDQTVLAGDTIF